MKDLLYASTLNQIATITTITTSYDNIFNRPESVETIEEFPCRISRKGNAYPNIGQGNVQVVYQMRCYFEIDANIKAGSIVEVDGMKYKAGLVYKANNHHIEVDVNSFQEA